MWQLGLGALLVVCGLGSAVRAEAGRAPLVLVVESSDGLTGANQLRATLSKQFGVKVLALGEVDLNGEQPGALMAIAIEFCSRAEPRASTFCSRTEPRASTHPNAVRVVYVDVYGRRDMLRAPAPSRREDMPSVVQALAGALLQRHLKDLTPPGLRDPQNGDNQRWLEEESRLSLSAFSRSLHAALNRIGYPRHRSGDLHRDDF